MKKIPRAIYAGLALVTIGLGSLAVASPAAVGSTQVLADCHVYANGVDVTWC